MNDIDFLPQDYLCVQRKRSTGHWLRGACVVVLALIAAGWNTHRKSLLELTAQRDRIVAKASDLLSNLDSADELKSQLTRLENEGHLVNALRCKVPPSRWIDAINAALPAQTIISELRASLELDLVPVHLAEPASAVGNNGGSESVDPVEADLQRLARLVPRQTVSILVRGTATDDLEVSRFLNALQQNSLFERVQLLFTDQKPHSDSSLRSFAIRVRTQPLVVRLGQSRPGRRPSDAIAIRGN